MPASVKGQKDLQFHHLEPESMFLRSMHSGFPQGMYTFVNSARLPQTVCTIEKHQRSPALRNKGNEANESMTALLLTALLIQQCSASNVPQEQQIQQDCKLQQNLPHSGLSTMRVNGPSDASPLFKAFITCKTYLSYSFSLFCPKSSEVGGGKQIPTLCLSR